MRRGILPDEDILHRAARSAGFAAPWQRVIP
jgi:hypothetical protein